MAYQHLLGSIADFSPKGQYQVLKHGSRMVIFNWQSFLVWFMGLLIQAFPMRESTNPPLRHSNTQFQAVLYFSGTTRMLKRENIIWEYLLMVSHLPTLRDLIWIPDTGVWDTTCTFWQKCSARKKSSYMFYLSWLCASVLIYSLLEAQAFCKALAQYEVQQSSLSNSRSPLLCLQFLFPAGFPVV